MKWVVNAMHRLLKPQKETQCSLHKRLGGPQSWSWWLQKISPIGSWTPDCSAHSKLLYWLCCPCWHCTLFLS